MFDFETLHSNHKMAFLDGFLTCVATTIFVALVVKEHREDKATRARWTEAAQNDTK